MLLKGTVTILLEPLKSHLSIFRGRRVLNIIAVSPVVRMCAQRAWGRDKNESKVGM